MRFDPGRRLSAAEVVNRYPETRLRRVIRDLGDEPWAGPIAAAIARRRRQRRFETTRDLAHLIGGVIPRARWPRRIDPATKTFQAIRIEVNDELGSLRKGLEEIVRHLKPGGRLGVVAFHSLEDKVVKDFLHVEARDCICPPQQPVCTCGHKASVIIHPPHPLRPGKDEIEVNPRSRSARLRVPCGYPFPRARRFNANPKVALDNLEMIALRLNNAPARRALHADARVHRARALPRVRRTRASASLGVVLTGIGLIGLLGVAYVAETAAATQASYRINGLRDQQRQLATDQQQIRYQISLQTSAGRLDSDAGKLGMVRSGQLQYVPATGNPVALATPGDQPAEVPAPSLWDHLATALGRPTSAEAKSR